MKLSVRRSLAVLAAGAALVTAGCGSGESGPNRAAVVDGTVISQTELMTAMREVNAMEPALVQQALTPSGTLTALVQAPVVLDFLAGKGVVVSDSVATRDAQGRGVQSPSDSTLEIVKLAAAISSAQQSGQITEADGVTLSQQLAAQEVVVNPRYGTFDPQTASVALGSPEWIRSADAAP
ncbi:MAG TPA: hypothetical protein VLQ78_08345 [Ornithinibacter sp.]|nr:hypothetical protein [Ornithinibacter sp.]